MQGIEILSKNVKNAPQKAGVYRMISASGQVLYVGKAKNIKKRIVSYTHLEKLPLRLQKMVSEIDRMEFIVVENESKALLMENELIKQLSPKYNILLKDDKTFPHIMIDMMEDFPALRKHRGKTNKQNKYFGPFANVGAVNNALDVLQKAFLLRNCSDSYFKNRQRPCLMHQIKRCSAPCVNRISKEDYKGLVRQAIDFLEGKNAKIQQELSVRMDEASKQQDYEKALVYRDRIRALTNVQQGQKVEYAALESADVIGLYEARGLVGISIFFIRGGQNCGNNAYFPKRTEAFTHSEILEAFLSGFYGKHIPPKEIIVSKEIENSEFLSKAIGARIVHYKQGNKSVLIKNAVANARMALEREMALRQSVEANLEEFKKVFGLSKIPHRIEIYDNSHIQGSYAIGAYVVAIDGVLDKKHYRTFNIKNEAITNDDFAMMEEVLSRRFAKLTPENKPNVVIIDGGLGQLNAVYKALQEFDLDGVEIIAMSKGVERNAGKEFYHMREQESFALPFASPLAFYLQNLRDEAHRFAIGTHRKKRAKSTYQSQLDKVEGIGMRRKRDLLNHFGSVEQISQASAKDIEKVAGISKKIAENIYNFFNN